MFKKKALSYFGLILLVSSCAVTNNLYINDPVPSQKDEGNFYVGIGSGIIGIIDSFHQNSNISIPFNIDKAPNVYFGGQTYLTDKLDFRLSLHFPGIIGGIGLRVGTQYSFFQAESIYNMAIGTDLGFVVATDLIFENLEITIGTEDNYANMAINADFFVPMSYSINQNTRLILTPRYSLNSIQKRENSDDLDSPKFSPRLFSLAVGLKVKKFYFEFSTFNFLDKYYCNFGMAYMFLNDEKVR